MGISPHILRMNWSYDTLEELLDLIWFALAEGAQQQDHPFHVAALGTRRDDGGAVRAMILRRADAAARHLTCSTDLRASKVAEIRDCPGAEWMFYDPRTMVQIRARGPTVVHAGDATARGAWEATPLVIRAHYASPQAPGEPLPASMLARLGGLAQQAGALVNQEAGWPNFGLLATTVTTLDWLQIAKTGPRHVGFRWDGTRFQGAWLA